MQFALGFGCTCPIVDVIVFLFFYNLVGPDCVRVVLVLGAGGAEPVDQLAEGTPVFALLLALQGFIVVGVGVAGFEVLIE